MNFLKRYALLIAAALVVALGATLAITGVLPKTDKAQGTQSDPDIGSSKYPAPKVVNSVPPAQALAKITNPGAIPALSEVNTPCPEGESHRPHPADRPSLQDDAKGAQTFADMPTNPSTDTYKCAIGRAKAAGYYVVDNSVKCDEDVIRLLDPASNTERNFRPFCMGISQASDASCKVTLIVTDYEGNFLWDQQPDLSRLQDFRADGVRNDSAYAGC